jgi:hypothetical protein
MNILVILILGLFFNLSFSSSARILGLGGLSLVIEDETTEINGYNFGENVAGLYDYIKLRHSLSGYLGSANLEQIGEADIFPPPQLGEKKEKTYITCKSYFSTPEWLCKKDIHSLKITAGMSGGESITKESRDSAREIANVFSKCYLFSLVYCRAFSSSARLAVGCDYFDGENKEELSGYFSSQNRKAYLLAGLYQTEIENNQIILGVVIKPDNPTKKEIIPKELVSRYWGENDQVMVKPEKMEIEMKSQGFVGVGTAIYTFKTPQSKTVLGVKLNLRQRKEEDTSYSPMFAQLLPAQVPTGKVAWQKVEYNNWQVTFQGRHKISPFIFGLKYSRKNNRSRSLVNEIGPDKDITTFADDEWVDPASLDQITQWGLGTSVCGFKEKILLGIEFYHQRMETEARWKVREGVIVNGGEGGQVQPEREREKLVIERNEGTTKKIQAGGEVRISKNLALRAGGGYRWGNIDPRGYPINNEIKTITLSLGGTYTYQKAKIELVVIRNFSISKGSGEVVNEGTEEREKVEGISSIENVTLSLSIGYFFE